MLIKRLKLKNWRNFLEVDVPFDSRTYVMGANASGKSNLFEVFRFLRTVAKNEAGGLQTAIKSAGGFAKLRCLHSRKGGVSIEVDLAESRDADATRWRYVLAFQREGKGLQRVLISEERVEKDGQVLLARPNTDDQSDPSRLTQTHLEQINNNADFRVLAEFFSATTYLHLVPQLLKFADNIGGRIVENDPFGQGLLQSIARTSTKTRDARIKRVQSGLEKAVPQFSQLRFIQDEISGLWHLEANFKHWRGHGAWQREDQFSDGTLRLIGLLWSLQEGDGLLLLEEPELSLNDAIVERIPLMINRVLGERKKAYARQVLVSTHSDKLLSSLKGDETLLLLESSESGTSIRPPTEDEHERMEHGLNPAEVLLPLTRPEQVENMGI